MTTKHEPARTSTPDAAAEKRPYRKPALRELGSVRELTLSETGSVGDGEGLQPRG